MKSFRLTLRIEIPPTETLNEQVIAFTKLLYSVLNIAFPGWRTPAQAEPLQLDVSDGPID